MEPLKIESFDPRVRNVHLRSLYKEAEEFDINSLLRKCITLSSLHNLLLGQEPFVPGWLALDGDTSDAAFWIETLTEVSTRSNEFICGEMASLQDLLEARSQALCTSHAVAQLRKNRDPSGHAGVNQAININGKRPRTDTNESLSGDARSANNSPKCSGKPKLTLRKWLDICDGNRTGWRDIHAEWNHMIIRSKTTKTVSWKNIGMIWDHQGLTLSLGYFTDVATKLRDKCSSLISELSKGQPSCSNAPHQIYIPIVRGLGNLWPDAKNTEFECCIREVVYGNFKPQAAEQLLGYILDLARISKGSTITVHRKSREEELKRAEALCRRKARQFEEEQKEKAMKQREELCRQVEEDFGRDRLALDDERASVDIASAKLKEAQEIYDERKRILAAKEASCSDREAALKAKEASLEGREHVLTGKEESCIERGARTKKTELELQEKLEAYESNQRLLLEGQRRLKKDEESHARNKAKIAKQDTANNAREKSLKKREGEVEVRDKNITSRQAWVEKKLNLAIDREKTCAAKEAGFTAREEALCKEQATVTSETQELEGQKSVLRQGQTALASEGKELETQILGFKQDLALHREGKKTLKADSESIAKERSGLLREQKEMIAGKKAFEQEKLALRADQGALSRKQKEDAIARKTLENDVSALRKGQTALCREKEEVTVARVALEKEMSKLRAKQALYDEEKKAWRERMRNNMRQMEEMEKSLSAL